MQFRLSTLMIVMAAICVYLGLVNAPSIIALPVFYAIVCLSPAYWVTGVIYARDQRRAFFIGGIAAGVVPHLLLAFYSFWVFEGPWRFGFNRYEFGETQIINVIISLCVFAPALLAFIGGWIGLAMHRHLRPEAPATRSQLQAARQTPPRFDSEESHSVG